MFFLNVNQVLFKGHIHSYMDLTKPNDFMERTNHRCTYFIYIHVNLNLLLSIIHYNQIVPKSFSTFD